MSESIFTLIGRETKALVNQKLNLTGGRLTGYLELHQDPTLDNHASTKSYVDLGLSAKVDSVDLGTIEEFYGGVALASNNASVPKLDFDQASTNGSATLSADSSLFGISTSYGIPSEITFQLSEVSNDGTDTIVSLQTTSLTKLALDHLIKNNGTITVNGAALTFS